jgi:transcriptional regulator with XRE-family HTH domain
VRDVPNPNPLGERIKKLRLEQGLTTRQLGQRAGLSANSISAIERGIQNLTVKSLEKIATGLGMKPNDIGKIDGGILEVREIHSPEDKLSVEAQLHKFRSQEIKAFVEMVEAVAGRADEDNLKACIDAFLEALTESYRHAGAITIDWQATLMSQKEAGE